MSLEIGDIFSQFRINHSKFAWCFPRVVVVRTLCKCLPLCLSLYLRAGCDGQVLTANHISLFSLFQPGGAAVSGLWDDRLWLTLCCVAASQHHEDTHSLPGVTVFMFQVLPTRLSGFTYMEVTIIEAYLAKFREQDDTSTAPLPAFL